MTKKILLILKMLKNYPKGVIFSFKEINDLLRIKPKTTLHIFMFLKEIGVLDFELIPFNYSNEKRDKIENLLGKTKSTIGEHGVSLKKRENKIILKILKTPSIIDSEIEKFGIYPEKPYFDKNKNTIFFENKKLKIPSGNQLEMCKIIFSHPFGELISENTLAIAIDRVKSDIKGNRFIYDTMLAINKKMEKSFGIKGFIEWNLSKLRIKNELFR